VVLALFLLGGEIIHDFAFALLVGVLIGTYSSIYVASPVAVFFDKVGSSFWNRSRNFLSRRNVYLRI
jgi:preprotein translocase subunit SecF